MAARTVATKRFSGEVFSYEPFTKQESVFPANHPVCRDCGWPADRLVTIYADSGTVRQQFYCCKQDSARYRVLGKLVTIDAPAELQPKPRARG